MWRENFCTLSSSLFTTLPVLMVTHHGTSTVVGLWPLLLKKNFSLSWPTNLSQFLVELGLIGPSGSKFGPVRVGWALMPGSIIQVKFGSGWSGSFDRTTLYHKWDVKNDSAFGLHFFSLIFDGLGGVQSNSMYNIMIYSLPTIYSKGITVWDVSG